MVQIIETAFLSGEQKEKIIQLWNREYPAKLAVTGEGFDLYFQNLSSPKHFLLYDIGDEIAGWAFSFDRDGDRWFSIIVESQSQGQGLGKILLDVLKENETQLNGWVIDHDRDTKTDGRPYISPLEFYLKNGFQICTEARYESNELSAAKIQWNRTNLVSDSFDID